MVKIPQRREKVVRNTEERNKCIVIFGDIEKDQSVKRLREKEETERAKERVNKMNEEEANREDETEEIHQVGLY